MHLKTIFSAFIVVMMISSGLLILAEVNPDHNSVHPYLSGNSAGSSYNLTFVAVGLPHLFPNSDEWNLLYYNESNGGITPVSSFSPVISVQVQAGVYYYQATDYFQSLFQFSRSPAIKVDSNTTVYVDFTPLQSVTFSENGLGAGYSWRVNLSGSAPVYSPSGLVGAGSLVIYYTIPGTLQYTWSESLDGTNTTVGSSVIYLENYNLSVTIPMFANNHVIFTENNLPPGTIWFIRQVAGPILKNSYAETIGSTLSLNAMNGENTFVAGYLIDGNLVNLTTINLNVQSQYNYVSVNFPDLYEVNISATNLPPQIGYYDWGIEGLFTFGPYSNTFSVNSSESNYVHVLLPESSLIETPFIHFDYLAGGSPPGYTVFYGQSALQVSQSSVTQTIHLPYTYYLRIDFKNLPSPYSLSIESVSGDLQSYNYSGTSPNAKILLPNGTYDFTYSVNNSTTTFASEVPFTFTVSGTNETLNFTLYNVNFTDSNFQSDFQISVGSQKNPGSEPHYGDYTHGSIARTLLINGSYSFDMASLVSGPSNLSYLQVNGNFSVSGKSINLTGEFPEKYYNLSILTEGLSDGSQVYMVLQLMDSSVSGTLYEEFSAGHPIYLYLPVGEYYISGVTAEVGITQYYSNNTALYISGNETLHLDFSTDSYLNFIENGLPSGTSWSVNFAGVSYTSSNDSIVVPYNVSTASNFSVANIGNYYADPSSGSILTIYRDNFFNNTYNQVLPVTFTPGVLSGGPVNPVTSLNLSTMLIGKGSEFNLNEYTRVDSITSDSANGLTYIVYSTGLIDQQSFVVAVNSTTYTEVSKVDLGGGGTPLSSAFDQKNGILYIALEVDINGFYSYIASLNTSNNKVNLTPENISYLTSVLVDQNNGMIYAGGINGVYEINPSNMGIVSTILLNSTYSAYNDGAGIDIAYIPQTGLLYATGYIPNGVVVIDPTTNVIQGNYSFTMGGNPLYSYVGLSTYDPTDGMIYYSLQNYSDSLGYYVSYIVGFNVNSHTINTVARLGTGYANSMAFDPANGYVYVPLQMYASNTLLAPLSLGQLDVYVPSSGFLLNSSELSADPTGIFVSPVTNSLEITYSGGDMITLLGSGSGSNGLLEGSVNAPGTTVTIDGVPVPLTGNYFAASLQPGTYYVTAFAKNYAPFEQSINIQAFSRERLNLTMNSASTTYQVSGTVSPEGASVLFNDISANVSKTGNYMIYLTPGKYTVSASINGYFPTSRSIVVNSNTNLNLTLSKEPSLTSALNVDNFTALGFNVTVSSILTESNDTLKVQFNSSGNGTLLVEAQFSDLKNVNISTLLNSRITINSANYSDFTITLSSNYTIILKVFDIKGDPTLVWNYGTIKTPPVGHPFPEEYYIIIAAVIIVVAGSLVIIVRRNAGKR